MSIQEFLEYSIFQVGKYNLTVHMILMILVIFIAVKLALWIIKKALYKKWAFNKLDKGSEYALFQIIKYFVWVLALVLILETLGVKVTILLAGSAALLVGIGLGLQQTFNDIISGIILLIEGSTKIGDILEVESDVVKVQKIGIRASKVIDRDDIVIIIPNSLIVTNKVINWSHQAEETRFSISVGVAYGSDVELVCRILEQSASEHPSASKNKPTEARFCDFGESSLNFDVLFWSRHTFTIERVKSDIRKMIDKRFRESNVTIPFPQRDLHFKTSHVDFNK